MKKDYRITLQISILGIFLTLFLAVMITIILVTNNRFSSSLTYFAHQEMAHVTEKAKQQLQSLLVPVENATDISTSLIERGTINPDDENEMMLYTLKILRSLAHVEMVYWGDQQGNFVISRLENNGTISSEIINRKVTPIERAFLYRDKDDRIIKKTLTDKIDYDPRKRPWYLKAEKAEQPVWSDAYIFYTNGRGSLGITSAVPIYQDKKLLGVFGIDLRLRAISRYLKNQKVSKSGLAVIINESGQVIATQNLQKLEQMIKSKGHTISLEDLDEKELNLAFSMFKQNKKENFTFTAEDNTYLASITPIPSFSDQNWYIVILVPEDDFIGELKKANRVTLLICLCILAIGILLITTFSRKVSESLRMLTEETKKIENFDLDSEKTVHSHINEINILSEAISTMRNGLRAFKKYVPADLVRLLIVEGKGEKGAEIGGKERDITIMFTDIQNFTQITEEIQPEELMTHLCDYFDELTNIIKSHNGTIDKYIGDAIMAFWNAPIADEMHSLNACQAAIDIQARLELLNAEWKKQGKPQFITRIGIATGKALVGNIGSYNRLNYTVLGDTVNEASRLEVLNKVYGTGIIISEKLKNNIASDFFLRKLDCVVVKGKSHSSFIYEIIAHTDKEREDKIFWLNQQFEIGFSAYKNKEWQKAIEAFQSIKDKYPEDTLSDLFMTRCKDLNTHGAPDDWDGIWHYQTKGKKSS